MRKSNFWISEITKFLENCGISVTVTSEFRLECCQQRLLFVPAGSSSSNPVEASMIVHEDLFHTRRIQLLGRLKSQLGLNERKIHGRATKVREIPRNTAMKFVDENHLMGFGGGKFFLGLFLQEELVSVAVFSKARLMKFENPTYLSTELERFCSLRDTTVVGGLDKVIRHFFRHYKTDDLVTMVDKEWSSGRAFLNLGFELVSETPPMAFAVNTTDFSRRVITIQSDLKNNEYLVRNAGNLKLRKYVLERT